MAPKPPRYVPKSLTLGANGAGASFEASFPGWPESMIPNAPTPKRVVMHVALPAPPHESALALCVRVEARDGTTTTRPPTADELAALFDAWWDLRNAALEETHKAKPRARNSPLFCAHIDAYYDRVRALKTAEPIALACARTLRIKDPATGTTTIAARQPGPNLAPDVPDFNELAAARARVPKATTPADAQKNVQKAIKRAEGRLGSLGNGYAWAVAMVMEELGPVLDAHIPGFDSNALKLKG